MARSIVLGNGELCVAMDDRGGVRDVYFPHVGLEDHVRGHYVHRIGVWIEGRLSWLSEDSEWNIDVTCEKDALVSSIVARHSVLQVELVFKDAVYNEKAVFIRRVSVTNKAAHKREIKLYFAHQFEIYKSHGGDTAYFDPISHSIIHYKGQRVFLISASLDGEPFGDYATGRANFHGKEGTHKDAEDGSLSKNPIEHGPADSVIGLYGTYAPGQSRVAYYTMSAARSIPDSLVLNAYVAKKSPEHMLRTTTNFWHAWVNAEPRNFYDLSPEQIELYKRSLLYMRANVDADGGIIASVDSDMLQFALDTYAYVWPRDSAYVAIALDAAGDANIARNFFAFCRDVITEDGYLMHDYLPDRSLGSSWHPWIQNGQFQLPIQEDETALVVYAFYEHYKKTHDLDLLEEMYNSLIEKAANFLVRYRSATTGLPDQSYDLWERKRGVSTFTASTVYAALIAAAELSKVLGKDTHVSRYRRAAQEVQSGILANLWDEKSGTFINMLQYRDGKEIRDSTIDASSAYGIFAFGVLPVDDTRLIHAFETTIRTLSHGIGSGGIARFENDEYYRIDQVSPGNPWVITTLWYAEYLIARAKTKTDLEKVHDIFNWVLAHAQRSGVLSEQLNPQTGEQIGAAPLTWSHGAYVLAVLKYLERMKEYPAQIM